MAEKKGQNTAERVYELALPLADELGYMLWDVRFEKEGSTWYLRIFIDHPDGISVDDCERFSRPFDKILDDEDPISQSYVFEVGSPGLGRDLRRPEHFESCLGCEIRIRFIRQRNGEKEIIATLNDFDKSSITVELENGSVDTIMLSECAFVKLYDDGDLF